MCVYWQRLELLGLLTSSNCFSKSEADSRLVDSDFAERRHRRRSPPASPPSTPATSPKPTRSATTSSPRASSSWTTRTNPASARPNGRSNGDPQPRPPHQAPAPPQSPSPLAGEGARRADEGFASANSVVPRSRSSRATKSSRTPHPALRATFSHKGRRGSHREVRPRLRRCARLGMCYATEDALWELLRDRRLVDYKFRGRCRSSLHR